MAFQPELGQMMWGQPSQEHDVPEIFDAALQAIRDELQRVLWNLRQRGGEDPFGNHGASFKCEVFAVASYSWDDDLPQPWNFKHYASGLEVSWYKYLGRGMSANRTITPQDAADVLKDCLSACRSVEAGAEWSQPGLYPEGPSKDRE